MSLPRLTARHSPSRKKFRCRSHEKAIFKVDRPVSPSMSFMSIWCPSFHAGCCCLSCFAACRCCHSLQRHACIVSSGSVSQNPSSFVTQLFQLLYPFDESQTVCTHCFLHLCSGISVCCDFGTCPSVTNWLLVVIPHAQAHRPQNGIIVEPDLSFVAADYKSRCPLTGSRLSLSRICNLCWQPSG